MLTIKTAAQILGAQNLKGFRSCTASTGVPVPRADARRVVQAAASLLDRELRRQWLAGLWDAHQTRARRGKRA